MKLLRLLPLTTAAFLPALWPIPALAHPVNTNMGGIYAGMMHPLTSAEHLLPMLVLALLASQCGRRAAGAILLVFPMALLAGTFAGSLLAPSWFFHLANLVVIAGLGGLFALGNRFDHLSPTVVGAMALVTGSILGCLSGLDMAASKVSAQFIPGVALTGFIAVALIAAWVPVASSRSGRMLIKLAGAGCAMAGIVLLIRFFTGATLPAARVVQIPGQQSVLPMLWKGELSVPLVVGAFFAAMLWGAGHALTPGHGKSIVAAYLLGSRSTPWHALYLGLTVTVTHTLGVFTLGIFALFASRYMLPDQLYGWLAVVSGLTVVGLGAAMFWKRVTPLLARGGHDPHNGSHQFGLEHLHDHDHQHSHGQGCKHDHAPCHGHGHSHLPPVADDSSVTWRYLLGIGISGGILPCPSALLILLTAVADKQVALGIALVIAFSLGLAAVLTIVGLLFVKGSRLVQRLPQAAGWWGRVLSAASALVITAIGGWLTIEAVSRLRL